uniref:Uncharacterized protein n=1 Tax=Sphaerodactylus townsendi TaxID=933632 RepID=A0ACB8FD98_9SAUR
MQSWITCGPCKTITLEQRQQPDIPGGHGLSAPDSRELEARGTLETARTLLTISSRSTLADLAFPIHSTVVSSGGQSGVPTCPGLAGSPPHPTRSSLGNMDFRGAHSRGAICPKVIWKPLWFQVAFLPCCGLLGSPSLQQ